MNCQAGLGVLEAGPGLATVKIARTLALDTNGLLDDYGGRDLQAG
jgi:hypothetical protein